MKNKKAIYPSILPTGGKMIYQMISVTPCWIKICTLDETHCWSSRCKSLEYSGRCISGYPLQLAGELMKPIRFTVHTYKMICEGWSRIPRQVHDTLYGASLLKTCFTFCVFVIRTHVSGVSPKLSTCPQAQINSSALNEFQSKTWLSKVASVVSYIYMYNIYIIYIYIIYIYMWIL